MSEAADHQVVYDLMRQRLLELFGPGGSFRVSLGRATADEGFFAETIAETVAWEVAAAVEGKAAPVGAAAGGSRSAGILGADAPAPRHGVVADPQAAHEALWSHVEAELLIRRTGPNAFLDDVDIVATPAPLDESAHVARVHAA
ncbi:MAG: hypothetical protein ABJA94_01425 [Rhodoglobus sp.]